MVDEMKQATTKQRTLNQKRGTQIIQISWKRNLKTYAIIVGVSGLIQHNA